MQIKNVHILFGKLEKKSYLCKSKRLHNILRNLLGNNQKNHILLWEKYL